MNKTNRCNPLFPDVGIRTYGRIISLAAFPAREAWGSVTQEEKGRAVVRVAHRRGREQREFTVADSEQCHQSCVFQGTGGRVFIAWNAFKNGGWGIYCLHGLAGKDLLRRPTVVRRAGQRGDFCLSPAGANDGKTAGLCWPERINGRIRIMLSLFHNERWSKPVPLSPSDRDAFRPSICMRNGRFAVAFDEYTNGCCSVRVVSVNFSGITEECFLSHPSENWFAPKLLDHQGKLYVFLIASRKVRHKRGMVDHACYGLAVGIDGDKACFFAKGNNTEDQAVADMREGLLAVDTHCNSIGLRRNQFLLPGTADRVWCAWEHNPVTSENNAGGRLLGREYDPAANSLSRPYILHEGGYGYAVSFAGENRACAAFRDLKGQISFADVDLRKPGLKLAATAQGDRWASWSPAIRFKVARVPGKPVVNGRELNLYWTDTHCHGNFSGDAEGEVDELIHYARDVAKLDAVCVADNDFYPSKSLTPAEWMLHQDFAEHYTEPEKFVVLPGYEFTLWEKDGINHRILLYARRGGVLRRRIDKGSLSLQELFRSVEQDSVRPFCYAHHATYKLLDRPEDRIVEICSSWRASMAETDFTLKQIAAGRQIGFIGSSDTHRAVPGMGGALTGVYAKSLTAENIIDALRNRRTIVTQGFRIFISFKVNGLFIGEEGPSRFTPFLKGEIRAKRIIERVDVFRDGEIIRQHFPKAAHYCFAFKDRTACDGVHSYFLQIKLFGQAGFNLSPRENSRVNFSNTGPYPHNLAKREGCYAWTSPVWTRVCQT